MTKAFSILHRAAALLVALCLLVGMALPVYAAEDGALFFDADSETIPTISAETTAEESTEPEQNPVVTDSETVPGKENTPPAANEPETETETTVQSTETVPNNDGKTQEAAENQTPAADTDTAPADPALTNKTPADLPIRLPRQTMPSTQRKPRRQKPTQSKMFFLLTGPTPTKKILCLRMICLTTMTRTHLIR